MDGTNTVNVGNYIVTENVTFTAVFRIQNFTVTFTDGNTALATQQIDYGGYATAPASPTKENYSFVGWSVNGTDTVTVNNYAITGETTFTALFKINEYTVTFKNGNTVLSTQQIEHGGYAALPTDPTKAGYVFTGWSVDGINAVAVDNYAVKGNVTFVALFKVEGNPFYIGYDTLGNGSNLSIDFDCVGEARTGETVTFSLTLVDLSDRFEDYKPVEITRVVVQDEEGEEVFDLDEINGVKNWDKVGEKYYFSFTMPDNYKGAYITVLVYLMRI